MRINPSVIDPKVAVWIDQLTQYPTLPNVCNPWHDGSVNLKYDHALNAAAIRRTHLACYLSQRVASAKIVLIAEAPGYQGARFSGLAMTSERILLGHHPSVPAQAVLGRQFLVQRTSRHDLVRSGSLGMNEPTATVVWSYLLQAGFNPNGFVLWNTFAFHPHQPNAPLSNRTPTAAEVLAATPLLHGFLDLFPNCHVVALGRIAEHTLSQLGVASIAVRHPSMGGATLFKQQMHALTI